MKFKGDVKYVNKTKKLITPSSSEAPCDGHPPKKGRQYHMNWCPLMVGEITEGLATPTVWLSLSNISSTDDDQRIIVIGLELNVKHINYGQALILRQFGYIQGVTSTLLL